MAAVPAWAWVTPARMTAATRATPAAMAAAPVPVWHRAPPPSPAGCPRRTGPGRTAKPPCPATAHPVCAGRCLSPPGQETAGVQVAAVFLHLDGFTAATDSAGHAAGDLLVTQAARRMRGVVPAQHTLARWGDDEFAILVEARAGAKEVVDLAEQLTRCI